MIATNIAICGWPVITSSVSNNLIIYSRRQRDWRFAPKPSLITTPMKVYSEREALEILFPTAKDRKALAEAEKKYNNEIRISIKNGEINPIRGWRLIKGMDQKELSRLTGIKQPNISRMERLGAVQKIQSLRKISTAFKINVEELIP